VANIINNFLNQLGGGTNLKDYKHATRLFVDSNYRLAPKYGFLFHVAFDLNPNLNRLTNEAILEAGMLVKSAQLPKFTVDNKVYNAYNRPNIVQTKLKYDPITITFHDDSADVIRYFWWNYYQHYYRDSDHTPQTFNQPSKYSDRQTQNWGYSPAAYSNTEGSVERMLNSIRVYSMHQRKFTEYTLINPTITSFKFGDHENNANNNTMEITMTVAYEAVLYSFGTIVPGQTVNGFAILHYDKTPSPLTPQGGGTQSILGPGGLTSALDVVSNQLGQGNWLGAGLTAFKSFNTFKGANLGQIASNELKTIGMNILTGNNPLSKIQIPSFGGTFGGGGGSSVFGAMGASSFLSLSRNGANSQNSYNIPGISDSNAFFSSYSQPNYGSGGGVATSNGAGLNTTVTVDPVTGQRTISYDAASISLAARSAAYEDAKSRGFSDVDATNYAASVGNNAGANALASINLNSSPGPTNSLREYSQVFGAQTSSSPAETTYLSSGSPRFEQGAVAYPVVDYSNPQFLQQSDIDREQAEADAYNESTGNF
jgi:hypothetical protein